MKGLLSLRDPIHKPHRTRHSRAGLQALPSVRDCLVANSILGRAGLRFVSSLNAKGRLKSLQSSPMKQISWRMIFDGAKPRDLLFPHQSMTLRGRTTAHVQLIFGSCPTQGVEP
jgi:hypothetical protein